MIIYSLENRLSRVSTENGKAWKYSDVGWVASSLVKLVEVEVKNGYMLYVYILKVDLIRRIGVGYERKTIPVFALKTI